MHARTRVWLIKSLRWAGRNGCNDYCTISWWIKSFRHWIWCEELSTNLRQAQMLRRSMREKSMRKLSSSVDIFAQMVVTQTNKQAFVHGLKFIDPTGIFRAKTNTFATGMFVMFRRWKISTRIRKKIDLVQRHTNYMCAARFLWKYAYWTEFMHETKNSTPATWNKKY